MCKQKLLKDPNIIDQTKHFTENLISIVNEAIVKTSTSNKLSTSWFNDDCSIAIHLSMAALRKFNKELTAINLNAFQLPRAKTRKIIKESKKKIWQNYVNRLDSSTRTNTIWMMIRKISGKSQPTALKHPRKNKTETTTKKDVADTLAETFSVNFSINNSNPHFLTFKNNANKQKLNFKSNNSEKYNPPFTPAELQETIEASLNTAIGPDEILDGFLKHLP